ncbi:MAG: endolytic transglycosylase MltG [Deltaproteobacteria bacterium]|nr:endolytic transglycosylase MltG [Deltaproteobacteria bacterium]MBW2384148.1 endolytic transglycosylase MltG [Deltaproteobacteria bacterium]MBW2695152.1 endolytic transglycosylase MltG [Deltaproteobacteria bacterium]
MIRWIAAAAVAGVVVAGAALHHARGLLDPVGATSTPRLFEVARGDSLGAVAGRLESDGLVRSATALKLFARWNELDGRLHVGEYELSPHQAAAEILDTITSGRVKTWPITVPEGHRASEIALRLDEAGLADAEAFMMVVEDLDFAHALGLPGPTLEGYLYPDTYHLPRGLPAREIARSMVRLFDAVWSQQVDALAAGTSLSKHEIVTMASIVEKETAAAVERPLIAAVFLNRLDKGMRLETDPTVIYGIPDFDGNLKKRHLQDPSNAYNTYRIRGLPPGPIASPGVEALVAVVRPSDSDYLYFVSRNDGTHEFSATYEEHVNAVNRYQRRHRQRR